MRTNNANEWAPIRDGDVLEFDGVEPTVLALRSFGAAAVYLVRDQGDPLLVGVGDSGELVLDLRLQEPHKLQVALEQLSMPAAYKARISRHTQPDLGDEESFVVIKPRIQESQEMRAMRLIMRQQQERFERQLTEMHSAGSLDRSATNGSARVPNPDGSPGRETEVVDADGDGTPDDQPGDSPNGRAAG